MSQTKSREGVAILPLESGRHSSCICILFQHMVILKWRGRRVVEFKTQFVFRAELQKVSVKTKRLIASRAWIFSLNKDHENLTCFSSCFKKHPVRLSGFLMFETTNWKISLFTKETQDYSFTLHTPNHPNPNPLTEFEIQQTVVFCINCAEKYVMFPNLLIIHQRWYWTFYTGVKGCSLMLKEFVTQCQDYCTVTKSWLIFPVPC